MVFLGDILIEEALELRDLLQLPNGQKENGATKAVNCQPQSEHGGGHRASDALK